MKCLHRFPIALLVGIVLVGCSSEQPKGKSEPAAKSYEVNGKVVDVAADKRAVTLDHQDIPGLMKAMKMKFQIDDPKILEGIQSGDQVKGHLKVEGAKYVVTHLEKQQ